MPVYKTKKKSSALYREISILAIVPGIVGISILASWGLEHWKIGPYFISAGLALIATLFGGFQRFVAGFKDICSRKITVNVFVATALTATIAVGEFRAAAIIVLIMAIAGALESYTLDKTRSSIRDLLNLAPSMAVVRKGENEAIIPASDVQPGDIVVVRPGERISVDGVVTAGASSVNQAPITGESMPVEPQKPVKTLL